MAKRKCPCGAIHTEEEITNNTQKLYHATIYPIDTNDSDYYDYICPTCNKHHLGKDFERVNDDGNTNPN